MLGGFGDGGVGGDGIREKKGTHNINSVNIVVDLRGGSRASWMGLKMVVVVVGP